MRRNPSDKFRQPWLPIIACLVCALLIKPVQDRCESRRSSQEPEPDLLYFSSPAAVKGLAMGFDNLVADFYWMRTIQYYGRRDEADKRSVRYGNLPALLDITTTLDPHLLDAYRSGSSFLAEPDPIGAGKPREALKLLDKGIHVYPRDWRLYYDKGFVYYWFLQDYQAAGNVWMAASKLPEAPYWMSGLAAMSLSRGGAIEIALALWQRQYHESNRKDVRENARNHLLSFQVAKDLWTLEFLVKKFHNTNGTYPKSLRALLRSQQRKYAISDPSGIPYAYNPQTGEVRLSPESQIRYLKIPEAFKQQLRIADSD